MEWTPLAQHHRELLDAYLGDSNELSNLNFTNFLLWDSLRHYQIAQADADCLVRYLTNDGQWRYFFPLTFGDTNQAVLRLLQHVDGEIHFEGLAAAQAAWLRRNSAIAVSQFENDRDHADYIYLIDRLINLKGQAYKRQRNFCRQFQLQYDSHYLSLDAGTKNLAHEFLAGWFKQRSLIESSEWQGIQCLLSQLSNSSVKGGLLLVDGQVAAVTISEALNQDTVVIHVEKADTVYRGSYQEINRLHLQNHWSHMNYVNRQQDLGIAGLRKAKLSYHPVAMVEKYRCAVKMLPDTAASLSVDDAYAMTLSDFSSSA